MQISEWIPNVFRYLHSDFEMFCAYSILTYVYHKWSIRNLNSIMNHRELAAGHVLSTRSKCFYFLSNIFAVFRPFKWKICDQTPSKWKTNHISKQTKIELDERKNVEILQNVTLKCIILNKYFWVKTLSLRTLYSSPSTRQMPIRSIELIRTWISVPVHFPYSSNWMVCSLVIICNNFQKIHRNYF